MTQMTIKVNGKSRIVNVDPATPLLYVLRNDLELHGPDSAAVWRSVAPAV
jgi:nicotinate dehydrogenase subunit A